MILACFSQRAFSKYARMVPARAKQACLNFAECSPFSQSNSNYSAKVQNFFAFCKFFPNKFRDFLQVLMPILIPLYNKVYKTGEIKGEMTGEIRGEIKIQKSFKQRFSRRWTGEMRLFVK